LNEIDLVFTDPVKSVDDGIDSLMRSGDAAAFDWKGVEMVEEAWRQTGETYIRQRFYRNANWMNAASQFTVYPTDAQDRRIGTPLIMAAGRDDQASEQDDGFIRRFAARQVATGCKKQGDCTGAQFFAQMLVQVRHNRHRSSRTAGIPPQTAALELEWSQKLPKRFTVPVKHATENSVPFGYGFQVSLDLAPPANGRFFAAGEHVKLRPAFRDGNGRSLSEGGKLPTYAQVMGGAAVSGLGYYNAASTPPPITH
jgi:hypothetical protein